VSLTVIRVVADEPRSTVTLVGEAAAPRPMVAVLTEVAWRLAWLVHEACVVPVVAPPTRRAPTTAT
jgi:hypothetical protein